MEDNTSDKVPEDVISKTASGNMSLVYGIINWCRKISIIHLCVIIATLTGVGFLALFAWKLKIEHPLLWAKRSIGIHQAWEGVHGIIIIYRTDILVDQSGRKSVVCKVLAKFENLEEDSILTIDKIVLEFYAKDVKEDKLDIYHDNSLCYYYNYGNAKLFLWDTEIDISQKMGDRNKSGDIRGCYTIVMPVDYFIKTENMFVKIFGSHQNIKPVEQITE